MSTPRALTHDPAPDIASVERRLVETFADRLPESTIRSVVRDMAGQFAHATVTTFVPLLVERYSRERLLEIVRDAPSLREAS